MSVDFQAIEELAAFMRSYDRWWAVAGGRATDLRLGRVTRDHHDIEVSCLRPRALDLWDFLAARGAEAFQVDPPGSGWWRWLRHNSMLPPSFQRQAGTGGLTFDVFLEMVAGDDWVFRRNQHISRPLERMAWFLVNVPVLRPEVQLLDMAKSTEAKNSQDFGLVAPTLAAPARRWLRRGLQVAHPDHRWEKHL